MELSKEHVEALRAFFAAQPECAAIVCEFEGEGDSGQINEFSAVKAYDEEDHSIGAAVEGVTIDGALRTAADELALCALEKQGVDWYNNDGGFGEVAIMRDLRVHCNTHQRYTETNSYTAEMLAGDLLPADTKTAE